MAAVPVGKTEFSSFIKWQKIQLDRLGVEIRLQEELTVERIIQERPDVVIDATGSHPFLVPIEGAEQPHVVTAHDVLAGKVAVGRNVVVIGGGLVGAETAEYVAYHGSQVSILEMQPQIAKDGEGASNYYMLQNLEKHHVDVYTNAIVLGIRKDSVYFQLQEQEHRIVDVDTVIMATGVKSNQEFAKTLQGKQIPFIAVGDAAEVKNGFANIQEGYCIGRTL